MEIDRFVHVDALTKSNVNINTDENERVEENKNKVEVVPNKIIVKPEPPVKIPSFFGIELIKTHQGVPYNVVYNSLVGELEGSMKGQCKAVASKKIHKGEMILQESSAVYMVSDSYFNKFVNFVNKLQMLGQKEFVIAMKMMEENNTNLLRPFYPRMRRSGYEAVDRSDLLTYGGYNNKDFVQFFSFVLAIIESDDLQVKKYKRESVFPLLRKIFLDESGTYDEACRVRCMEEIMLGGLKIKYNAVYIGLTMAIFDNLSAINHSCWPNAYQYIGSDRETGLPMVVVMSASDIPKNQEITVSYIPLLFKVDTNCKYEAGKLSLTLKESHVVDRKTRLKLKYNFVCKCARCVMKTDEMRQLEFMYCSVLNTEYGKDSLVNYVVKMVIKCKEIMEEVSGMKSLSDSNTKQLHKHLTTVKSTMENVAMLTPKYCSTISTLSGYYLTILSKLYGSVYAVPKSMTETLLFDIALDCMMFMKRVPLNFVPHVYDTI